MGHGLEAAVDMNAYRSVLREVASTDLAPHGVLRQLDSLSASDDTRRPATCLLVRIDPARGMALYASAGRLPPALFTGDRVGELLGVPVSPPWAPAPAATRPWPDRSPPTRPCCSTRTASWGGAARTSTPLWPGSRPCAWAPEPPGRVGIPPQRRRRTVIRI